MKVRTGKYGVLFSTVILVMLWSGTGCGRTDTGETAAMVSTEETAVGSDEASEIAAETSETMETSSPAETSVPVETIVLPQPSFEYELNFTPDKSQTATPLTLQLISEQKNQITDEEEWFTNNQLDKQLGDAGMVPETWDGLLLTRTCQDDSYLYAMYGKDYSEAYIMNIYDSTSGELRYSMDFSNYRYYEGITTDTYEFTEEAILWVVIEDQTLYVATAHNTYAETSGFHNAYLTAIDLAQMSVLWRSEPLVCNSKRFLILGDVILCGYGFTAEDDYLYQLDKATGAVIDRTLIASKADYLILKDKRLYVRTYDTDYVYEIN